ncbi:EAL domain-containing protein [Lactobacillus sp.]|uniref:EAL domain-containing protein n=1 Tax=Lactobacillus sp. TaxID=1591 RepID=UPI003F01E45E
MKRNNHAIFYSLIMAIIVLALGIVSFWGRGQGNFKGIYSTAPLTDIEQKWTDKNGKAVDARELKPGKDGTLTIYYRLPKKVNSQDKIIFFSRYIKQIDAYIGQKKIYSSHPEIAADWLGLTEHYESFTNSISLPAGSAGKQVRLTLKGFYQPVGKLTACSLGNDGAFLANYVRKNALRVAMGIISAVLGLTLLLFAFFAPLESKFKRSLIYYSIATILFSVMQMQEEMQLTVLFGQYHVWRLFTYPVMILMPYLLIMAINEQLEYPKQLYTNFAFALSMLDLFYVLWRFWSKGEDLASDGPFLIIMIIAAFVSAIAMILGDIYQAYKAANEAKREKENDSKQESVKAAYKTRQLIHWSYFATFVIILVCIGIDAYRYLALKHAIDDYAALRYGFFFSQILMFRQYFLSELDNMQQKGQDDTYIKMVNYDRLTGLYTQYYLTQKITKEREEDPSIMPAIVYINLAKFKLYNVINGHEKGDECLKQVAEILRDIFGPDNLARFGNDHFVIFDQDNDGVMDRIEEANRRVGQIDLSFKLYLKAGIYYSDGSKSIETECDYAKTACDEVKDGAEKCYRVYTEEFSEQSAYTKFVVDHIDEAIANGDIQVYYQPQVHLMNGKLAGLEALARWNDQTRGFMSPGRFVPVLEASNLTYKLDLYVLEEAAKLIKHQLDTGGKIVPISFNLSRTDFVTSDPNQVLLDLVKKYGIPREMLRVEITETILTEDPVKIKKAIDRFHANGFEVLMDDFGSGASSLNTLKEYGFDEIKLDMIFMRKFDERSKKVIKPLISMAKSLGVHTLCEGVESKEQIAFLKDVGCEVVQGYYYGKPNTFQEVVDRLEELGVEWEGLDENSYFETAGLVDVNVDQPLAIIDYDRAAEKFTAYYLNTAFRSFAAQIGVVLATDRSLSWQDQASQEKMLAFAKAAARSTHEQLTSLTVSAREYQLSFKMLVNLQGHALFKVLLLSSQAQEKQASSGRFEDLPLPYVVVRPFYDQASQQADCEFVSVNQIFSQLLQLPKEELLGKKLTAALPGEEAQWSSLPLEVLRTGRASSHRLYSKHMEAWCEFTLLPAVQPACVAMAFTRIEDSAPRLAALKRAGSLAAQSAALARTLNGPEDHASEINFSLAEVASLIKPERVYMFSAGKDKAELEYEWSKKSSLMGKISDALSEKIVSYCERLRGQKPYLYISDMESLRFDRELYDLNRKNVRILLYPLFTGKKLLGYLGVENFDADQLAYAKDLLGEYSRYLAAKLSVVSRLQQLANPAASDHLTGLGGAGAYQEKLEKLKSDRQPAALLYLDLYNLRDYNADHGPQEGNLLLQQTADWLAESFDVRQLYRISGEEFVAVMPEASEADLSAKLQEVKDRQAGEDRIKLIWTGKVCDYPRHILDAAKQLDQALNDKKAEIYAAASQN